MPDTVKGLAAALPLSNVDTDVIMPKRFLKTMTREGLADGTFADLRFDAQGATRSDFVLNTAPWTEASILIVGDNFGCGSSREHAVWGLMQLGVRCIIGTGFAGIFYDNARKNGLALPIIEPSARDRLLGLAQDPETAGIEIDIVGRTIRSAAGEFPFQMDNATQTALIEEYDETLDTLIRAAEIRDFETRHLADWRVEVRP